MQENLDAIRVDPELAAGRLARAMETCDETVIDPRTLAGLDVGLLRCLQNIGAPRSRICSALCLSYAEYDYIAELLREP